MFVLDRTLNTSHILSANKNSQSAFWEDTYTQEFDTGAESFEFSCYTHESIKEGNYVAFFYNNQYKMFQIIEVQEVHKKGRLVSECYCEIASLQLLNNYVKPFSGDMNCIQFFQHILHGTEWHIGKYSTSLENVVYTVNEKNIESVWSLIEDYKDIYGCEINVRVTYDNGYVTGQYIDIYAEGGLGSSTFKRFEYGVNVTGITKTKDLYDWCTGIILDVDCDVSDTVIEERDGYGFTKGAGDVILDDNANRMYNAGRTHVIGVYQGKETEPVEACINAWKELQKRKEPKFDYKVTTALKDEEYEDIHLGDTVYVVDHSYTPPLLLEARVGKLELSFTDRTQNSCTLTNYKEIKSKLLDADYIKLTGTITDVVNAFFPITSEGIADGARVDGKIETTYFQQITADIVSAGVGAFENLYAQGLTVINADIERLNVISGEITSLKSQLADIDTLINGHLTSDNIQSLILTSDKVTVADAFIKDAMIDSVTANKITSGSINTNNVYISSEDGSMIINGSLQQFKDKDGNVRIQIGKDAQDNFTFSLFDEDGQGVLINEKGITENAIADGLIVNDMVAEDAGIAGSKLDIDSVVTEINEGTTTIKGTKVVVDDNNQTLDMAFSSLKSRVESFAGVEDTNLLKNTAFEEGMDYWIPTNALWTIINDDSDSPLPWMTARRLKLNSFTHYGDVIQKVDLNHGATYTVSYWIKGYAGGRIVFAVLCYDDNGISYEKGRESIDMTGEYQKVEITFTSSTTYTKHGIRFAFTYDTASYTGACEVYMGMAKLEEGSVATDWVAPSTSLIEMVQSNTTAINVQQGQIDTLISNTTITKENGEVVQLKDEYNSTKDTVDSHATKIGSLETTVNTVSSKQASMELDLNGFRTEVSSTYATKEEVEKVNYNLLSNGKFENCYINTEDMIPSWICEKPYLFVCMPQEESYCGCLELRNDSDTTKVVKQKVVLELEKTYTLTFKSSWQQNVNGGVQACIDFYNDNGDHIASLTIPVANNEFELQTFTFQTPVLDNYSYSEVNFLIGDTAESGGSYTSARIGEVKLEEGDTYTGWRGSRRDEGIVINGENLIKNGDFSSYTLPRTIDGWIMGGDGYIWDLNGQDGYNKEGCIYFAHSVIEDVYSGFYQPIHNLKKRTEYTLTFFIDWEYNVREFYVDLVFYDINGNRIITIDLKPSHAGTWSYTFVTPDIDINGMNIGFCHRGIKEDTGGGFLGIAGNVKLTETEKVAIDDLGPQLSEYTTKTEFQQTNEDFIFKIQQSGGGNLLKNTKWKNGTYGWEHHCWDTSGTTDRYTDVLAPSTTIDWRHGRDNILQFRAYPKSAGSYIRCTLRAQQWVPVEPNATYSMSFYYRQHRCADNFWEIQGMTADGSTRIIYGFDFENQPGGDAYGRDYSSWYWANKSFVIPSDIVSIMFWVVIVKHNSSASNLSSFVWLGEPCLVEGSTPMEWCPHESEIYDGIVKIDSQGLTVQHANNKSVLDSEALKFYEGNELYSKVDGGLFKVMEPGDSSVTVGSMGRFKWVNSGTCCTCIAAGPGHAVSMGSVRTSGEAAICNIVDSSQGGYLTGSNYYYDQGLSILNACCELLNFKGDSSQPFSSQVESNVGSMSLWSTISTNSEGSNCHMGCIYGRDTLQFGIAYGPLKCAMEICEVANASNNSRIHMYGHLNMHGYTISNADWSNPVSASSEYTSRLLREGSIEHMNYGTLSYYDGELRWCWREPVFTYAEADIDPVTDEWVYTGRNICYVELPIFMAESIEADYHISVGKIGWGDYRILEKNQYYFILESQEEDFAFTFEVVAKLVDGQTLDNNVSIASMSTTANPAISVEPPTTEEIILPGSEYIWESPVVEEVDNIQENINTGEE